MMWIYCRFFDNFSQRQPPFGRSILCLVQSCFFWCALSKSKDAKHVLSGLHLAFFLSLEPWILWIPTWQSRKRWVVDSMRMVEWFLGCLDSQFMVEMMRNRTLFVLRYILIYITYMYMYILYIMSLLFRSEAFLFFLSESRFQLVFMMKTACYLEDHPTDRKWWKHPGY